MAYVAITKELLREVENAINEKRRIEASALRTQSAYDAVCTDESVRAFVLDHLWAPVADLRERLSSFIIPTRVDLHTRIVNSSGETVARTTEFRLEHMEVPCICAVDERFHGRHGFYDVHLDIATLPSVVAYGTALAAVHELESRWSKIVKQVHDFLGKCKSLNEAVKLWPDVRQYIPPRFLERLEQASETSKKNAERERAALEALKAIDFDVIQASNVLVRMASGEQNNGA